MANTLNLFPYGAVGFIDWLDAAASAGSGSFIVLFHFLDIRQLPRLVEERLLWPVYCLRETTAPRRK
jgi:hypothetical protein